MAQFSIVKKSELEGAMRLDAEYYQPKYLEMVRVLKQQPVVANVGSLCKQIYRYPTFYNLVYQDDGVLVLKGEDINPHGVINNVRGDHISIETSKNFPKTILKNHDLILSVRGYVGKVGLVNSQYEGAIISPNLIKLAVDSSRISPVYLWVFLNSRYGNLQLARAKMQTSQETIVSSDIKNILVPLPNLRFQSEIENIVEIVTKQDLLSKSLYLQAEQLLLDEVGFKDLDLSHQLCYTVPFKKTEEANRLDAEHFQPKYGRLVEFIKRRKHTTLGGLGKVLRGKNPSRYVEEGIPVIRAIDLRNVLDTSAFLRCPPEKGLFYLRHGDILISSIGWGSIGKVTTFVHPERMITVSEVSVIRQTEMLPFALQIFLQSSLGQLQLERKITGSTGQLHLYPRDIETVVVPCLAHPLQQRIADLVAQSWEARQKARQLLEEAKRKVEDLVEGRG